MDPEFSSDTNQQVPPVPIKTYQWEDVRRLRAAGGYPWTYLTKPPLQEEEITADTILRETTPKRSMSRDTSRERSAGRSPTPHVELPQTILNLTSSPGSSRKGGGDDGIKIPNFSKEASLESTEEKKNNSSRETEPLSNLVNPESLNLTVEKKISVSPKGILKRKHPDKLTSKMSSEDSPRNSKCCHPFVEKIKHIADKTLHRTDKSPVRKNVTIKKNNDSELQEIITLESSPGTERRKEKTSYVGISKDGTINPSNDNIRSNKTHIYEDIDSQNAENNLNDKKITFTPETIEELLKTAESIENKTSSVKEMDLQDQPVRAISETKSGGSQDPSIQIDEDVDIEESDHIMHLMKSDRIIRAQREALVLDSYENAEDNFNVTITDITDEVEDFTENNLNDLKMPPLKSNLLQEFDEKQDIANKIGITQNDTGTPENENKEGWSKTGDHEYEPVGKSVKELAHDQKASVTYIEEIQTMDDDVSSTTSQDRKYLHGSHNDLTPNEEIPNRVIINFNEVEKNDINFAENMQREIEDRYFINTPTTTESRTDCEISTSQVDSSALENLPLKRGSRNNFPTSNLENTKQRFRNQTTKLKTQADKLRNRIKNIKRPQFNIPEKPKFERHKFTFPNRPKINFPDRAKIKVNFSEKFGGSERPKFSFPERPKFSLPDRSKFKLPERAKFNFSAFSMQNRETRNQDDLNTSVESESDSKKKMIDFDKLKYPRIFSKVNKKEKITISYPITRADTPTPPEFATVPRMKNRKQNSETKWQQTNELNTEEPRQYGKYSLKNVNETITHDVDLNVIGSFSNNNQENSTKLKDYEGHGLQKFTIAQRKKPKRWNSEKSSEKEVENGDMDSLGTRENEQNEINMSNQTNQFGVIEEINKDEFFLRKKGISEENIEVGKYLSQEIRDAFRLPANALSRMDEPNIDEDEYLNSDLFVQETLDKSYTESIEAQDIEESRIMEENDDGYYTFPPVRPKRAKKNKKYLDKSFEFIDESITDNLLIHKNDFEKYESDDIIPIPPRVELGEAVEEENHFVFSYDGLQNLNEYENEIEQTKEPPTVPKRSKKILRDISCSEQGSLLDLFIKDDWTEHTQPEVDNIIVHRVEHEYVVPEDFEEFIAETPVAPERKRSRSRGSRGSCTTSLPDDDRTSRGAESLILDTNPPPISLLSNSEKDLVAAARKSPKYAVVEKHTERNKDLPPRPLAPVRRQRSARSLSGTHQFFTVPGRLRDSSPPKRPHRNYSTLGPSRPPRKKSTTSLITLDKLRREESSTDVTQYVEIDDDGSEILRDLQSGKIVSKMKDRPLPPPPIPSRRNKKTRNSNKLNEATEKNEHENFTHTSSVSLPTEHKPIKVYETEEVVEIEVSTQTDPLPDDFNFELSDEEPLENQKVIFPRTANDFENKSIINSINNINQDSDILAMGLQKFRESSRPASRSGTTGTPVSRPKTCTGRTSPTAILVERRISSPTRINQEEQVVTTASLTVQPINDVLSNNDKNKSFNNEKPQIISTALPMTQKKYSYNEPADETATECIDITERQPLSSLATPSPDLEVPKPQLLQISNLDVGNLNVSELQAHKLLVSEIQGLSLRTSDLNTDSSNIVLSGVELAPSLIDEIVQKFSQLISEASPINMISKRDAVDASTSSAGLYCEEETQTEKESCSKQDVGGQTASTEPKKTVSDNIQTSDCMVNEEDPPQRPPPPFYPYLPDFSLPSSSFYRLHSSAMERPFTEFYQGDAIPGPSKRRKPRPVQDSSSEEEEYRPSPRKPHHRNPEPSVSDLGGQFVRACQNSISRTVRGVLNYIMDHFTGRDGKKDVQMALVIFLVLIAGLIMLGVGDRTVHHHHWEFFNPPTDPNT